MSDSEIDLVSIFIEFVVSSDVTQLIMITNKRLFQLSLGTIFAICFAIDYYN